MKRRRVTGELEDYRPEIRTLAKWIFIRLIAKRRQPTVTVSCQAFSHRSKYDEISNLFLK